MKTIGHQWGVRILLNNTVSDVCFFSKQKRLFFLPRVNPLNLHGKLLLIAGNNFFPEPLLKGNHFFFLIKRRLVAIMIQIKEFHEKNIRRKLVNIILYNKKWPQNKIIWVRNQCWCVRDGSDQWAEADANIIANTLHLLI